MQVQQAPIEGKEENDQDKEKQLMSPSPWKIAIHNQDPQLRRSTRIRKPQYIISNI